MAWSMFILEIYNIAQVAPSDNNIEGTEKNFGRNSDGKFVEVIGQKLIKDEKAETGNVGNMSFNTSNRE